VHQSPEGFLFYFQENPCELHHAGKHDVQHGNIGKAQLIKIVLLSKPLKP
jgi:hypothetical protein